MVQYITNALLQQLIDIVQKQLLQLNTINIGPSTESAILLLEGDQYKTYTLITNSINSLCYTSVHFFVTGPGGIGKSFLFKSLEL